MNIRISYQRYASVVLATVFFFVQQAAQACPGCRQAAGSGDGAGGSFKVNNVGIGYGLSIIGLLLMIGCLLAGLGYVAYKNCQIIAARQQAMLDTEDADFGGGLRA